MMLLFVIFFLQFIFARCASNESEIEIPNFALRYLNFRKFITPENETNEYEARIIGGEDTNILEIPYQVSLQYKEFHICGGAIVTAKHIVTAAHCIDGRKPILMSVRAGSTYRDTDGVIVSIKHAILHPLYDKRTVDNDVAVLVLSHFLPYNEFIQPIVLATAKDRWEENTTTLSSGWGLMHEYHTSNMAPRHLQAVALRVINMAMCERVYGSLMIKVSTNMLCIGSMDGFKDTCKGDSGGPLVINGVLAGVVSFGFGCARVGIPGIYTSIPAVRGFLDDVIFDNKDSA